jgi:hypothetical protein
MIDVRAAGAGIVCVGVLVAAVGCGSGSGTAGTTTATSPTVTGSSTATQSQTITSGTTVTSASGTSTTGGAENLQVTDALRAQLLRAGAASNGIPASDYTGLVHGQTYYAYDPTTGTYWAGAHLVPSASSTRAQVSVQDDGAYLLFTKPAGGTWHAYSVGMTGIAGATCPVAVPSGVLTVWGWAPGTCRPTG